VEWTLLAVAAIGAAAALAGQWLGQRGETDRDKRADARADKQRNDARLDHVRALLEKTAAALHAAAMQMDSFGKAVVWIQQGHIEYRVEGTAQPLTAQAAGLEEMRTLQDRLADLYALEARVSLWLAKSQRALVALSRARAAYTEVLTVSAEWIRGATTGPKLTATLTQAQQDLAAAEEEFYEACRVVVAPQLPGES
jgi:hypothetical protein